ncbi:hypothetical protein AB0395_45355 [Streptosporangium sp. NPDC051023]|uniref:hypothetical protein n=1 Tax=Streptosporangium sp. NPDC051023 TaxID=3155410 RepID=UPI00344C03FB
MNHGEQSLSERLANDISSKPYVTATRRQPSRLTREHLTAIRDAIMAAGREEREPPSPPATR